MKALYRYHMLAFLLYVILTILVLHSYLFNNGLIEYGDTRFHINLNTQVEMFSKTWNDYNGYSFIPRAIQWPIYAVLSVFNSSLTAQRVLYFALLMIIQLNMYLAVVTLARDIQNERIKFLAGFIGGLIYLFNPWVPAKIGQWYVLWCYAFIPLIFAIIIRGISSAKNVTNMLTSSAFLAIVLFAGSMHWYYVIFHVVFMVSLALLYTMLKIFHLRKFSRHCILVLRRTVLIVLLSLVFYVILEAYWLLPYIIEYRVTRAHWEPIYTPQWVISHSPSILDSFRLLSPSIKTLYFPWRGTLWFITTILIPVFAFYAYFKITSRYKKYCQVLDCVAIETVTILALILIFLDKGSNPPFGESYLWLLFDSPFSTIANWMFRVPYRLAGYLAFTYAYLVSTIVFLVYLRYHKTLKQSHKKNKLHLSKTNVILLSFILITLVSASIASYPVINDFQGVILPVNPPKYYSNVNEYILTDYNKLTNYFRIMWLPSMQYPFYLDVNWSPHPSITPDPRIWLSDTPVYEYGASPYYYVMYWFIKDILEKQTFKEVGSVLSLLDVRYLIYQQDTVSPQNYIRIFQGISSQKDLRFDRKIQGIFLYKNVHDTNYIYSSNTLVLALGSLDILPVLIKAGLDPQKTPILFLEQEQLSPTTLKEILDNLRTVLVICKPKELNDLVLDVYKPLYEFDGFSIRYRNLGMWSIHFINCPHWIPYFMIKLHNTIPGWHYDLTLGKGILVTTRKGATITIKFTLSKSGNYTIWLRVLRSPRSGKLEVLIDKKRVAILDNRASWLQGFKWMKVVNIKLNYGEHIIEIRNLEKCIQAINIVKIVNTTKYEKFKHSFLSFLKNKVTNIIYIAPTLNDKFAIFQEKKGITLFNQSIQLGKFIARGLLRANHKGRLAKPQLDIVSANGFQALRIRVPEGGKYERWCLLLQLFHAIDATNYSYLDLLLYGSGSGRRFYVRVHTLKGFYTTVFRDNQAGWHHLIISINSMKPHGKPTLSNITGIEISPVGINVSVTLLIARVRLLKAYNLSLINTYVDAGKVNYIRISSTKILLKSSNISKGILVLSEAYDGKWSIRFSSKVVKFFPVNFVDQGVIVSSKCDEIFIEYTPERVFNIGKQLTTITLTILILFLIASYVIKNHTIRGSVKRIVSAKGGRSCLQNPE